MSEVPDSVDVPDPAVAVARRYQRLERPISSGIALLAGLTAAVAILTLPLVTGLGVTLGVFAALRVPVLRSGGTVRLVSDAGAEAVRADFVGPTPPLLAFQWAVADTVATTADGAQYELSYLFGLRSVTMRSEVTVDPADGEYADADLVLSLTAAGRPWGTYSITIDDRDGETVVEAEWRSDRRFGLRSLPQVLVASRYRRAVLAAQGYTVAAYDRSFSV